MIRPNALINMVKSAGKAFRKFGPQIAAGVGVTGMTVFAGYGIKKAFDVAPKVEAKKEELGRDLKPKEFLDICWKDFAVPAVGFVASGGLVVGGVVFLTKQVGALAVAAAASSKHLSAIEQAIPDVLSDNKRQSLEDKVAAIESGDLDITEEEIQLTGRGNTLFYEPMFGHWFRSDLQAVRASVNDANEIMWGDMSLSMNEFYEFLGLARTDGGDLLGWRSDHSKIDISYRERSTKSGELYFVLEYRVSPESDYMRLYS